MAEPSVEPEPEESGGRTDEPARLRLTDLATPLLLYAATRVVQLALIVWLAPAGGPSVKDRLLVWDGGWFVRVATEGYPHTYSYDSGGQMVGNGLAFFPVYPLLIRGFHALGMGAGIAALVVSWTASAVAAILLYLLGTDLAHGPELRGPCSPRQDPSTNIPAPGASPGEPERSAAALGRRFGVVLMLLFVTAPMSVVLSMGYSEAVFSAFVIGMFYAVRRNSFLVAGALGLGAALTRPTGLAAAVALALAALLALRAGTAGWRAVAGAVVALLGVPAYLLWVAGRVGDLNAWFTIQTAGWGTTFDWGVSSWDFVYTAFRQGNGWVQVSVALILVAAIGAAVIALRQGVWPPLAVYGVLALILVVGQAGYYHSKPRLLVPVLLTLLPLAHAATRARPRPMALALTAYGLFGLWYGAYMITVWPFTI
jgi:hypothetical protein